MKMKLIGLVSNQADKGKQMSEAKQVSLDYNGRMLLIRDNFCKSLQTVLRPHTHLRTDEAAGLYMKEISSAINDKMSTEMNTSEIFVEQLRKVWTTCLSKHKSQFWFDIGTVQKAAGQVNTDWVRGAGKKVTLTFGGEAGPEDLDRQKGGNWENPIARLKETDDMIAAGKLPRGLGLSLRKIPIKAAERMGIDVSEYLAPPPSPVDIKKEPPLPPRPGEGGEPKPDFDLIKSGMQKPKFEDLPSDDEFDDDITKLFDIEEKMPWE
jgi:hypothetical protein